MLAGLLESLRAQTLSNVLTLAGVIVIDNDAAGSARELVTHIAPTFPWPLKYDIAPDRNISIARNRGVQIALAMGAEFIAFTDDDCVASSGWLRELVSAAIRFDGDIVWGKQVFVYEHHVAEWLTHARLHAQPKRDTGDSVITAESNNALVRSTCLVDNPFDPAFGLAGGGDSLLFLRARLAGARIIWAEDAVVYEATPASRATVAWLMRRAFREGNCGVFVYRAALPTHKWLPLRAVKTVGHFCYGVLLLASSVFRGRSAAVTGLRRIALAAGMCTGLFGYRFVEYRRVHGS